jgi:hypothetical protein
MGVDGNRPGSQVMKRIMPVPASVVTPSIKHLGRRGLNTTRGGSPIRFCALPNRLLRFAAPFQSH